MSFKNRIQHFEKIETMRNTKLISFVTGDRPGVETYINNDCIDPFINTLNSIGNTNRISLLIQTDGGDVSVAWRLVNLIKMFCDEFEIIIPHKSLSAGTLIALGANRIIMTKQAVIGPIDPSINNPLGPTVDNFGHSTIASLSVEAFNEYLEFAQNHLAIESEKALSNLLSEISNLIHPMAIGEILRSRKQIRKLAEKLLSPNIQSKTQIDKIIDFLCAGSGSHDYTLNRREAQSLGLNIEKPDTELYKLVNEISEDYRAELNISEPFFPQMYECGELR